MPKKLPVELRPLVKYAQKALTELQLIEVTGLTLIETQNYSANYPKKFFGTYSNHAAQDYSTQALKILDYFIVKAPDVIFDVLEKGFAEDQSNLSLAAAVNSVLEKNGANGMARYLGPSKVPEFVDNERLYKKKLWLEWLLNHLLRLVAEGKIVDFSIPLVGGVKSELELRFNQAKKFVDLYQKNHPEEATTIAEFRKAYQEKTLDNSFSLAMKVLKPDFVTSNSNVDDDEAPAPVIK